MTFFIFFINQYISAQLIRSRYRSPVGVTSLYRVLSNRAINKWVSFQIKKATFLELKVSCCFIINLQPTNSNVKLLQCYGIFLTSHNLTCTRIKNTPQSRNDSAHQRMLQKPSTPQSVKWGRYPGITSTYVKTQDCSILSIPALFCWFWCSSLLP